MSQAFRYLLFALGLLLAIPLLAVFCLSRGITISSTGIIYFTGYLLIVSGLICAPWLHRWALVISVTGIVVLLASASIRILSPPAVSQVKLITLPGPSSPRLLARIFDEQDIVLFGAKVAPSVGYVSQLEYEGLISELAQTYEEMQAQDVTPFSPALATYLGQQRPDEFDALIADPSPANSETGIIFLHGFGGNFTLQCWLIAKAGSRVGAATLCPSTNPSGQWWEEQDTVILEESLSYLKERGAKRIYLAGLSNGGIGASRLADRLEDELAGLILISGADPYATVTELPILVIHGKDDERIPASIAEQYAALTSPKSTYRLFEGDHFVLLKESDQVQEAVAGWLTEQESHSPVSP